MKCKFDVTGMSCAACQAHVEKAVNALEGVDNAAVNLLANSMVAEFDESKLSPEDICAAVDKAGYHASVHGASPAAGAGAARQSDPAAEQARLMKHRLILSIIFLVPLFYLCMGHMVGAPLPPIFLGVENSMVFTLTQLVLVVPIMYINDHYFIDGFRSLWHRSPNMDSLIALGSSAAFLYSLWAIYMTGWALGPGPDGPGPQDRHGFAGRGGAGSAGGAGPVRRPAAGETRRGCAGGRSGHRRGVLGG